MTRHAKTAKLLDYLVDYDGPQLAALKSDRNRDMLAHAVRRTGMKEPFFGCEVPEKAFNRYFDGTVDLSFAFHQAGNTAFYFFDNAYVDGSGDVVDLFPATLQDLKNDDYWPSAQIFSRSHTSLFNRARQDTSIRAFKIDGKWGASDFSHFYGKMSDLYALFAVLNRIDGATAPGERAFLAQTLRDRLWRGGGSYGGFYDDLDERNSLAHLARLEVAKIEYASPGKLELRGNADALSYTTDVIAVFEENWESLTKTYNEIYNTLRKAKMLGAEPDTAFPANAIRDHVLNRTTEFAHAMKLENIADIYTASGPNVLVFAKLILSIYRRASQLYIFQAEGRVRRIP